MKIKKIREKYPQYDSVDDRVLLEAVHKKFYGSMTFEEFVKEDAPAVVEKKPEKPKVIVVDNEKSFQAVTEAVGRMQEQAAQMNAALIKKIESLNDNKGLFKFLLELPGILKKQSDNHYGLVLESVRSMPSPVVTVESKPEIVVNERRPRKLTVHNILRDSDKNMKSFEIEVE